MEKSKDNKAWSDWDLEKTAQILFKRLPRSFIWVVRSSVFDRGTFACYSNFIEMDACGTPVFEREDSTALLHVHHLLDSAVRKGIFAFSVQFFYIFLEKCRLQSGYFFSVSKPPCSVSITLPDNVLVSVNLSCTLT